MWDKSLSSLLRIAEKPGRMRGLAAFLAHSGDSWYWFLGLALVWLMGDPVWKYRAAVMVIGIFGTAVVVILIKFTVRRRRPAGEWGEIYRRTDPNSFPSGHAARAALLAVLAVGLGPTWLGLSLLLWAPLISLARVAMGVHYASDVLAGIFIGMINGLIILAVK
jgi:membrane-associated phospholipid phosphatase